MDNQETANCFNDVKETFLNTQLAEELSLLTPRDIRETINSWATTSTDKERVGELIFEWLEDEYPCKKDELSPKEKHKRLLITVSNAREHIDFVLTDHTPTDDRRKSFKIAEEKDAVIEEQFRQEVEDWGEYQISQGESAKYFKGGDERIDRLRGQGDKNVSDYLQKLPNKKRETVKQSKHHGKCDIYEYKKNMCHFLDNIIPTDQNNETRLLNLLDEMGYGYSDELNGYLFLFSFLSELMRYEFIICREITPYTEEIRSFKRYKHDPEDKVWEARLNYYKNIGVRNRHRHSATLNSNKWAISFEDFAKLYRKILGLSNKAISTPLQ